MNIVHDPTATILASPPDFKSMKTLLLLTIASLTSCTITLGPDGNPLVSADPVVIGQIADRVADKVNDHLIDATK